MSEIRDDITDTSSSPAAHKWPGAFFHGPGLNILLVIVSGLLAGLVFLPHAIWWLAWVALVPLLIALRRTTVVRAAGWFMLLFGLVFFAGALPWLHVIFSGSVISIYVLISLPFLLFGFAYRLLADAIARWRWRRIVFISTVLLAPVCWLASEWVRCEGWYFRFSWAQLGFALAAIPRGTMLYPLIGVYGVTFVMLLVNALLAEIVLVQICWRKKLISLLMVLALIVPFSCYINSPARNNNPHPTPSNAFRASIVQNESANLRELKQQTIDLASAKPALVVWPEYALFDYPLSDAKLLGELQTLARTMNCTLILGCKEHLPDNTRVDWLRRRAMMSTEESLFANTALIIGQDGLVVGKYHKKHPIQFFADGVPGTSSSPFVTAVGKIGIGICYDFDFAASPLRLVQNGAEVLVLPTYDSIDWTNIQHNQHARMAQARAAETGRVLIRPTSSGLSQIITPTGQQAAVIPNGDAGTASAIVYPLQTRTLYIRVFYLLPYICLAFTMLSLLLLLIKSARNRFLQRPGP